MLEKPKINEKEAVVGPFLKRPFRLSVVDHIVVWDNCRDALVMLSTYMHAAAKNFHFRKFSIQASFSRSTL